MLEGALATALNLLSIAVLAYLVSVVLICVFTPLILSGLKKCTFKLQKVMLWWLVTLPWWVAISCVTILWTWYHSALPVGWLDEVAHWHHIDVFHVASWHAFTIYGLALYLLYTAIRGAHKRVSQWQSLRVLIALSDKKQSSFNEANHFYSLPSPLPTAFVTGMFSPKVYVTDALQKLVGSKQMDIILRHEFAHVTARDPLFRTLFSSFTMLFPSPINRILREEYVLLTELEADRKVAQYYDNLDIAQTLIDITRYQQNGVLNNDSVSLSYFGNDATRERVECLITPRNSSSKVGLSFAITLIALMPFLTASTVDSLHHIIETFFIH